MSETIKKTIDARGLACPQPVILSNKALKETGEITVIVDNEAARYNVTRMAQKQGAVVEEEIKQEGIFLHLTLPAPSRGTEQEKSQKPEFQPSPPTESSAALVLVISDDKLGKGDPELGDILIRSLFHTLGEVEPKPEVLIFFNSGVKLTTKGSKVLEDLKTLHSAGLEILVCGTCLSFYNLKEDLAVGEISNMYTIAETMLKAVRVINF